mgnify:CR=1 FL=1
MAVRVSKPEVNLRDKLNKAEPPIGAHGSQLLKSKSTSETFDLVRAGRRNLIINGNMEIWQRSANANVTGVTGLKFGPDRWMFEEGCANLVTVLTRSTDTPYDQGFRYSFQLSPSQVESALDSSDFAQYMYFVEGYDFAPAQWGTINAKPCTLSFWFKTNMGGEHYVTFTSSSGIDTWSTSIRSTMNVWEHHVITVPPPMTGTWNYEIGRGVEIRIGLMRSGSVTQAKSGRWYHGGSGYNGFADAHSDWAFNTAHNAYLTGVQLEIGSQVTPFEHRPYAEELALCQRYCQAYGSKIGEAGRIAHGTWSNGTQARTTIHLTTKMRAVPSIDSYTAGNVLREAINWYPPSGVGISESTSTHVTALHSFDSSSGASANDFATWGNGAGVVLSAEI